MGGWPVAAGLILAAVAAVASSRLSVDDGGAQFYAFPDWRGQRRAGAPDAVCQRDE